MRKITVKLEDREIEISKIPIGRYVDLIKAIKRLPKHLQSLDNLDVNKAITLIPELMGDLLPDLVDIISIASAQKSEYIEKLGLAEITRIVEAIFKVNEYAEVYTIIKKMLAHPAFQKVKEAGIPNNPS